MKPLMHSNLAAAVAGGLVVAGTFMLLGVTGKRTTQTVIEQSPIITSTANTHALTPHAIYQRNEAGVVYVKALVDEQVPSPFDPFEARGGGSSTGSGFLISSNGFILTNFHVVAGADPHTGVSVVFGNDLARQAAVVGADQANDLALLKVDMSGLPAVRPLVAGDSGAVKVSDPTLAIGNPFGLDRTLSSGMVSALQRQIQTPEGFAVSNVIQTDGPLNPGNSGGPLLDAAGRVIGINSQIEAAAGDGGATRVAFAVPIDTAEQFISRVESDTDITVPTPHTPIPPATRGVVIPQSTPGGALAAAGLQRGDAVTAIDGHPVASIRQVRRLLSAARPGQRMRIELQRGGHAQTFIVRLGRFSQR